MMVWRYMMSLSPEVFNAKNCGRIPETKSVHRDVAGSCKPFTVQKHISAGTHIDRITACMDFSLDRLLTFTLCVPFNQARKVQTRDLHTSLTRFSYGYGCCGSAGRCDRDG